MNTQTGTISAWPMQAQSWLDARGKPAWIIAMVAGFIFFWPVGLTLLAYMIWSKRMFTGNCKNHRNKMRRYSAGNVPSSGNTAFDAYKTDTLRRLEEEQENFEAFLARLREAKDKSEFDDFMDERAKRAKKPIPPNDPIEI